MRALFDVPIFKTIAECAKITGLAKYRIRQIVLSGKVKFIKAGVKYQVNLKSLLDYLNAGDSTKTENDKDVINVRLNYEDS